MNTIDVTRSDFKASMGRELNLFSPKSLNEKLQWLKLFYQDPLFFRCSDKIAVKHYAREKIGRDICPRTLAVYRSPEELDLDALPDAFILKLNCSSGFHVIHAVLDKKSADAGELRQKIAGWLDPKLNHYHTFQEWGYKHIESAVLAEELLGKPDDMVDYKFFCFHGEPRFVYATKRIEGKLHLDFFDLDWNLLPYTRESNPNIPGSMPRPATLAEMTRLARSLAGDFHFVRVDLFSCADQIFLGELTLYPSACIAKFTDDSIDFKMGELLTLPDHGLLCPARDRPAERVPREAINAFLDLAERWRKPGPPPAPDPAVADDRENVARLKDKIHRMQTSFSWRATAPLRFLRRSFQSQN